MTWRHKNLKNETYRLIQLNENVNISFTLKMNDVIEKNDFPQFIV